VHILTTACLAVLCGYGVKAGVERMRSGKGKDVLFKAGMVVFGLLLVLDHLHLPVFMARHHVSPFYTGLARDQEDFALIDLTPRGKALFCTTVHGKRLVGGYVARASTRYDQFIENSAVLRAVFSGRLPDADEGAPGAKDAREVLAGLKVRYLVYPKPPGLEPLEKLLRDVLGRDGQPLVRDVPTQGLAAGPAGEPPDAWIRHAADAFGSAGWLQRIRLALGLRILLASRPEFLPSDNPVSAILGSERIVRDVWQFPVLYEDPEIRVYGVHPVLE